MYTIPVPRKVKPSLIKVDPNNLVGVRNILVKSLKHLLNCAGRCYMPEQNDNRWVAASISTSQQRSDTRRQYDAEKRAATFFPSSIAFTILVRRLNNNVRRLQIIIIYTFLHFTIINSQSHKMNLIEQDYIEHEESTESSHNIVYTSKTLTIDRLY